MDSLCGSQLDWLAMCYFPRGNSSPDSCKECEHATKASPHQFDTDALQTKYDDVIRQNSKLARMDLARGITLSEYNSRQNIYRLSKENRCPNVNRGNYCFRDTGLHLT